ncbi:MAG: response regulator [Pseudomonadota bacterium]
MPPAPASAPLRVLIVEDNADALFLACEMLKALGYNVAGAADAEAALAELAQARFDVLFSDVSLPGMSGIALARQALARQPGLQVIFASGYADTLTSDLDFPCVSLPKPYELERLQAVLAAVQACD